MDRQTDQASPVFPPGFMAGMEDSLRAQDEEGVRAWLKKLPAPLDGYAASYTLALALDCSADLFREVLDSCLPGEYAIEGRFPAEVGEDVFFVNSTLATIAAVKERPEHLRLLLERGWDPACESPASREALEDDGSDLPMDTVEAWEPLREDRTSGRSGLFRVRGDDVLVIPRCTPLAAAILCGSQACARLLWDWPGVRHFEDPGVCVAVLSAFQVTVEDGAVRIRVDPRERTGLDLAGKDPVSLLREVPLQPSAWADLFHPALLKLQLESGLCDRQEAERILRLLDPANRRSRERFQPPREMDPESDEDDADVDPDIPFAGMVYPDRRTETHRARLVKLVLDRVPQLVPTPWLGGILLRVCVRLYGTTGVMDDLWKSLADHWRRLRGERADLSWASNYLGLLSEDGLHSLLRALGQDTTLFMDSCAKAHVFRGGQLRVLANYVQVRPVAVPPEVEEGIGSLTHNLLMAGDLRTVKRVADQGGFQGEVPERLLACADHFGRRNLRPVLLSLTPGPALDRKDLEAEKKAYFIGKTQLWEL